MKLFEQAPAVLKLVKEQDGAIEFSLDQLQFTTARHVELDKDGIQVMVPAGSNLYLSCAELRGLAKTIDLQQGVTAYVNCEGGVLHVEFDMNVSKAELKQTVNSTWESIIWTILRARGFVHKIGVEDQATLAWLMS